MGSEMCIRDSVGDVRKFLARAPFVVPSCIALHAPQEKVTHAFLEGIADPMEIIVEVTDGLRAVPTSAHGHNDGRVCERSRTRV